MKYVFTLLLLLAAWQMNAQRDHVYLKDGIVLHGRVEDVNRRYVLLSNEEWRRAKKVATVDVHHIEYSDGTADTFSVQPIVFKGQAQPLTTKNILLGSPISGVALNKDGYVAIGFFYERLLGKDNNISVTLPLNITFPDIGFGSDPSLLLTPGFLFHTNVNKRADFAFGPSLLLANGNRYESKQLTTGALVNLRLNVRRTGTVFCVFNNFGVSYPKNADPALFFQLGIGIGGTF